MKDAIIVLGGGINLDGTLFEEAKNRVRKGVELLRNRVAKNIVMSGKWSFRLDSPPVKTEAEAMKEYAVKLGTPKDLIWTEQLSKDTIGNAYFTKTEILKPNGWKNIIVVTSEFHAEEAEYMQERRKY